ncbi:hypothetical protein BH10PLA2_BH10PLA2_12880 [soil metagenome]
MIYKVSFLVAGVCLVAGCRGPSDGPSPTYKMGNVQFGGGPTEELTVSPGNTTTQPAGVKHWWVGDWKPVGGGDAPTLTFRVTSQMAVGSITGTHERGYLFTWDVTFEKISEHFVTFRDHSEKGIWWVLLNNNPDEASLYRLKSGRAIDPSNPPTEDEVIVAKLVKSN